MSTRGTLLQTPTVEIDQDRYEELIKAEQKAIQYREEIKRFGELDYLVNIIEATPYEPKNSINVELEGGNEDGQC